MNIIQLLKQKFTLPQKIGFNVIWLFGEHIIGFLGGFFISIWLARHLGPAKLGIYGYAMALQSIAVSFAQLGMGGIAVKELVQTKNLQSSFSTIAIIQMIGGAAAFALLLTYISVYTQDTEKYWLTFILSFTLLFNPFTVISLYFDSKVLSKYRVISGKTAFLFKAVLIALFILFQYPLIYLAYIIVFEKTLSTLLLVYFYSKQKIGFRLHFDWQKAKDLLKQSWPLIISGLGAVLYLKIDQIMLVSMIGDAEGGYYNVAIKYTSIFYFLHTVIITSVFPNLLKNQESNKFVYFNKITQLSSFLLYTSLAVILGTYLFITIIITLAFGVEYIPSIEIIKVHIWCLPLVYLGAVLSKWLIMERLTKFSLVRHSMGLVVNLILNFILIPKYGGVGAAIGSFGALFFACIVVLVLDKKLLILLKLFVDAIFFPIKKINDFKKN